MVTPAASAMSRNLTGWGSDGGTLLCNRFRLCRECQEVSMVSIPAAGAVLANVSYEGAAGGRGFVESRDPIRLPFRVIGPVTVTARRDLLIDCARISRGVDHTSVQSLRAPGRDRAQFSSHGPCGGRTADCY